MNNVIKSQLLPQLVVDYEFKQYGKYLQQGKCPNCGKKELFASGDAPWILKCNRLNKCDTALHIKDLYPQFFTEWSKNYPSNELNPQAAAEAYLSQGRGFFLGRLTGLFSQESYFSKELNIGSATVRFPVADGFWERIIDKPERFGSRKANFRGAWKGHWWKGNQDLTVANEIWICEGIFDAIALQHAGKVAVSNMNADHWADIEITALAKLAKKPVLIWALDSDKAGRKATKNHIAKCKELGFECYAAQTTAGKDWNDWWQLGKLDDNGIDYARYLGDLLTATSAANKGNLIYSKNQFHEFSFEFERQLYWFKLDIERYAKAHDALTSIAEKENNNQDIDNEKIKEQALVESSVVTKIANCYPQALYYLRHDVTDESWYHFAIDLPDGRKISARFTGSQCSAAAEFKKRLLSTAPGGVFTGTSSQLDSIMKQQLLSIKTVETIDFIGYSKKHKAYVYDGLAFKDGATFSINSDDYFDIGKMAIKSLGQQQLAINNDKSAYVDNWIAHLISAYGAQGVIALTFWIGSLFAEQIREKHASYPFLEIVGEPGAGKTTLIEFLWKLFGREEYEGFDPSKATPAARARNFGQVSNLPVVLIEADRAERDRAKVKSFEWDELKTAYNGRALRSRGVKSAGLETYEPPFRGAIVISQNANVSASDAILTRLCHLHFDCVGHTQLSKASADYLFNLSSEKISYFIVKCLNAESTILEAFSSKFKEQERYLSDLPEIKNMRIAKNHAQLLALLFAVKDLIGLTDEQYKTVGLEIIAMAKSRQIAVNDDHPYVDEFFETLEYIKDRAGSDSKRTLNHSSDKAIIAINLKEYECMVKMLGLSMPPAIELKELLKTSKKYKFIGNSTVHSCIESKTKRCWCFEVPNSKLVNKLQK